MKNSGNNEMDVLLRILGKRAPAVSQAGNGEQQGAGHLDVDELNAFAERTLPPAARARYTTHIVDCLRCRQLVAQLSAAAGLPVAEVTSESPEKKSLWKRLPAFLSPQVLRFAVPALVILAVMTIGIITFRQQGLVARRAQPEATETVSQRNSELRVAEKQAAEPSNSSPRSPTQNSATTSDRQAKAGEKSVATDDKVATTVDSTSGLLAKEAPKPGKADEGAQPTFAPEPSPPPPAAQPQVAARSEADKNEAVAKQKAQTEEANAGDRETKNERPAKDSGVFLSRSGRATMAGRGGAAVQSVESRRNETEQAKRADDDEYTVAVAGRRFRKAGNTWIDVAYDTSRAAVTVVRGSEQYRALVADEPGIGTIADRLAGEVIVVWKGRAYRIR